MTSPGYASGVKILFLEIHHERRWAVSSIGPAFITSYLRANGHEVELLHVDYDMDDETLLQKIRGADPQLLGLSLTSRQWQRARIVVKMVREHIDLPVITGGLHPTFAPEDVLANDGFDYVCLGEGEEALLEFMNIMERGEPIEVGTVRNIQCRGGPRPTLRPPFEPIDALPFMARDMLGEQHGVTHMVTQRGCPFPCTYCAARKFHDLYGGIGTYGRRRSHENVLAEIEELCETQRVTYITFLDDTFTLAPSWVKTFCALYAERFGIGFSLHARAETIRPEMLDQLAAAGCKHITYGVESGSDRIRRDVMQRVITNEKLIEVFEQTRERGIIVTANYILGIPGETPSEIDETIALHELLLPDDFGYFVFYPYPGTALFHTCKEKGYLPKNYLEMPANHRESILTLPGLTQADIGHYYDKFTALREANYLRRYGTKMTTQSQKASSELNSKSAAQG